MRNGGKEAGNFVGGRSRLYVVTLKLLFSGMGKLKWTFSLTFPPLQRILYSKQRERLNSVSFLIRLSSYTQFNLLILSLTAKNKSWHWREMVWEVVGALFWGSQIIGENSEQKLGIFRRLIFFPLLSTTIQQTHNRGDLQWMKLLFFLVCSNLSGCCVLWAFIRHTQSVWIRIAEVGKKVLTRTRRKLSKTFSFFLCCFHFVSSPFGSESSAALCVMCFVSNDPVWGWATEAKVWGSRRPGALCHKNRQNDPAMPTSAFAHPLTLLWESMEESNDEKWWNLTSDRSNLYLCEKLK